MCDIQATIDAMRQFEDKLLYGPNIVKFDCIHQQTNNMFNNFMKNSLIIEKQSTQIIVAKNEGNKKKDNGANR